MAKRIPDDAGINTRLTHGGNDPHDYYGFINPPVVHASTDRLLDLLSPAQLTTTQV